MPLEFKQAKDRSEGVRQTSGNFTSSGIQALGMYFELTLDHKFSLCCASFKAFSLYTGPEERHRLRVSLYTPGCKHRLRAYTQSHYSPTARRKKTLLSYYRPHLPSRSGLQNVLWLPSYNLPKFGAVPLGCSIILRWVQAVTEQHWYPTSMHLLLAEWDKPDHAQGGLGATDPSMLGTSCSGHSL